MPRPAPAPGPRPSRALSRLVAEGLARPVQLSVLAVSGARVSDVVSSQLPAPAALHPKWVIVGVGSNDVSHVTSRGRFRASLDRLLAGIKAAGAERIALLGRRRARRGASLAQPLRVVAGLRADQLNADGRALAKDTSCGRRRRSTPSGRRAGERPRLKDGDMIERFVLHFAFPGADTLK